MKLALIAIALLATAGVAYAACIFCWSNQRGHRSRLIPTMWPMTSARQSSVML